MYFRNIIIIILLCFFVQLSSMEFDLNSMPCILRIDLNTGEEYYEQLSSPEQDIADLTEDETETEHENHQNKHNEKSPLVESKNENPDYVASTKQWWLSERPCSQCPLRYKSQKRLIIHIVNTHGQTKYKRPAANKDSTQKIHRAKKKKVPALKKLSSSECLVCHQFFASRLVLQLHQQKEHRTSLYE